MSRYIRPAIPGASIFFTVILSVRGSRLLVEESARLRAAMRATMAQRPFHLDAWGVLPDHMHAVWTLPKGDSGYSVRWGAIKARFTRGLRQAGFATLPRFPLVRAGQYAGVTPGLRHDKGEVALWQRRFWEHHIRDEADSNAHVRYCWNNPVKYGFTARAADWPYSPIHRDMRLGRVDPEWAGEIPDAMFGEEAGVSPRPTGCAGGGKTFMPPTTCLPCELLVLDPLGLKRVRPEAAFLVFLVILEIAFEPFHMRLALEGQDMRADAV